ncbi:putative surface protein with fasciclin (FAS1) repeats [Sediminihabitans luteus]|uniref:Putative surface protein with fasciclin (FAS1) repeats n=1 Tax=Sediminihabitans luteus TaxID=1138585 RepID=A0A2M9CEG2_9CELL|nr:fasciclin domain-containing protein [Sediminihabitans luteus]PJJ70321.1 putative surface protein with fasciclin (FAS1) repeats [Sediminihabitans luteus]GII97792.1 cell surface glycolipoprotein MPT83 [Sediminihabitans luteus]
MNVRTRSAAAATTFAALAVFGLAACSDDSTDAGASSDDSAMTEESMPAETPMDDMESDMSVDPAANLVGPGCSDYAAAVPDGAGSITGMSADPVAVAASNNPLLTTLVSAVSGELNPDVNLVDTLNGDEFTVFAPVDDAFAKVDAGTLDTLSTDADLLTSVLTYHVVPGQIAPDDIVGEHTTVEGDTVTVTGSGDELKVDDANVICGGVVTQNATVYLVDSVLMPSM